MTPLPPDRWSTLRRAFAAQAVALVITVGAAYLLPRHGTRSLWVWPALQGMVAAVLSRRLGRAWMVFQALVPFALFWQLGHRVPLWLPPAALLGLALIFGGGFWTRVPLYHSTRAAWGALMELVPEGAAVADLGAGFGGPMTFLARHRPDLRCVGVEASPLVWCVAWVRALPVRSRCAMRLGSLWELPLEEFGIVYAFLSPVPMPALWEKARREMRPGALLISHTFEIPDVKAEREIPLPGRRDACLRLYRIP